MATLNVKNFPDSLYGRLQSQADRKRRSLSQEVIRLEQAVEEGEGASLLELKGLGKEVWRDIDASRHVEEERNAWE